jgi:hypothetical protein
MAKGMTERIFRVMPTSSICPASVLFGCFALNFSARSRRLDTFSARRPEPGFRVGQADTYYMYEHVLYPLFLLIGRGSPWNSVSRNTEETWLSRRETGGNLYEQIRDHHP